MVCEKLMVGESMNVTILLMYALTEVIVSYC